MMSTPKRLIMMACIAGMALLAGCAVDSNPLWTTSSPRNGAGQPVNPIYGTPIPGYTTPWGG